MGKLLLVYSLLALCGEQVIAAEQAAVSGSVKKPPTVKKKTHKHKKDCVEKDGKPCHLHNHGGADVAKPDAQAKTNPPLESINAAVSAAAVVSAPAAVPAVVKPEAVKIEAKTEAVLSDAEGRKLAQRSGCFVCHAIDKKVVGPAWKDIAAKYRGDAGVEAKLITKVAKGGSGAWGSVPMPANAPRVSDVDIKSLVKFVLSLK